MGYVHRLKKEIVGTGFAQREGGKHITMIGQGLNPSLSNKLIYEVYDMHFIFGYQREIPVNIKTKASITALVGLAILIVLLFIFLSFDNLDSDASSSPPGFNGWVYFETSDHPVNSIGDLIDLFDFSSLAC
jgi:hypothetical protein